MNRYLILFSLFTTMIYAQNYPDYTDQWEEVTRLEMENLPKSALEKVEIIYAQAKKDQNAPQIVKTLLFHSKFAMILEEEAQYKVVQRFQGEIAQANFPTKNILQNMLAQLYWQYFQQNRWQFYNRTETAEKVNPNDFRTWDLKTIFREIQIHFENSLLQADSLQATDLKEFEAILIPQTSGRKYRPTCYDFLAHQALDFYKTDERSLTEPAYKFELNQPEYLGDLDTFSKLSITTQDSISQAYHALQLYQKLIQFHQKDTLPDALIMLDIERLQFAKQQAVFEEVDQVLLHTLVSQKNTYKDQEIGTLYDAEIVAIYQKWGNQYKADETEKHRWDLKKAIEIVNEVMARFPKSQGALKCDLIKNQILQPSLQITAEEIVASNTNSRLLVQFTNIETLYFKALKINERQILALQKIYDDATRLAELEKLPIHTQWEASLPNNGDYQQHSIETILPELPQGFYVILATLPHTSAHAYTVVQATDLALVEMHTTDGERMQILDRNTGKPISGAQVHLKNETYSNYDKSIDKTFVTDTQGLIKIATRNDYFRNITATVTKGDQKGVFGKFYLSTRNQNNPNQEKYYQSFLFTDRSIYRPGQTVYFKGLVVERKPDGKVTETKVLPETDVTLTLYDVNGQQVSHLELKTNAYGSVNGTFDLPVNTLTGNFRITLQGKNNRINGNQYFSVEAYKRPKFETTFLPITDTFNVQDTVQVTGNAKAYAGTPITEAQVVYRVHREVQFPRWWYWGRPSFYSEPQEITHGETTTDDRGNFTIDFAALPDKSIDAKSLPIFHYKITAEVTDINGETRSATTTVQVGYHSMTVQIAASSQWLTDDKEQKITLTTQNLNGENTPANGTIKIYKLQAPTQVKRARPWATPDLKRWDKQTFEKLFPHDYYDKEGDPNQWEKGKMVYEKSFENDSVPNKLTLEKTYRKWEPGKYVIVMETMDKEGIVIADKQLFDLINPKSKQLPDAQLIQINLDKNTYEPGQTARLQIGTSATPTHVFILIEKDQKPLKTQWLTLNNEIQTIELPILESDLGGFTVHYHLVYANSFKDGNQNVSVKLPEKPLAWEVQTFRDKIQPGAEQTWSFTLKGLDKEKLAAEVLASMYDASLDQFKPHQWSIPAFSKITPHYARINTHAGNSFRNINFRVYDLYKPYDNKEIPILFDVLNWFDFSFYNIGRRILLRGVKSVSFKVNNNEIQESETVTMPIAVALEGRVAGVMVEDTINSPRDLDVKEDQSAVTDNFAPNFSDIKVRTNFNETAFFYPDLKTDTAGNVSFSFTSPEALTRWKLQLLGHTPQAQTAYHTATTLTQKDLMVQPNAPRFLRESDTIVLSTKISSLLDKQLQGFVQLELTDPFTGKNLNEHLGLTMETQSFEIAAQGNTAIAWSFHIPIGTQAVQYKIVVKAGDFSDGEQNVLPVLSNRMLVTETLPMWVNSGETRTFTLDKLKNNTSTSLTNHKLTLEVTSHPVWYAIQSLPYLMEFPHECAEQTFSRYYANALATKIIHDNPKIKAVFDQWENTDALLSNLEKNEKLKSILIAETPWLRDAQSETEQKKRIALLFDLRKMNKELETAAKKLYKLQFADGGFPWFSGSHYPNRYITQHIAAGFGHLEKLGAFPIAASKDFSFGESEKTHQMLEKAIAFLDNELIKDYEALESQAEIILQKAKNKKQGAKEVKEFWERNHLSNMQLHYLYTRTFYPEIPQSEKLQKVMHFYQNKAYTFWKDYALYQKGLIALVAHRSDNQTLAQQIVKSIDEYSITHEELGMYWKENTGSWYWYQAPIETQALMIETFAEVAPVQKQLDAMKVWLLKNKQTNRWATTKATTEAIYALLAYGTDWLPQETAVTVVMGDEVVTPPATVEAGTGYYKVNWEGKDIKPEQATVSLTKTDTGIAWGGLYWQYFEDLDKITFAETPLKIEKKLFLKRNEDTGEKLYMFTDSTAVKVGDLIRVRIELRVDRDMEYVHMKDMRASGLEPINVLSQYKYQDGLGYYESTRDAATNFFFSYLPKGVYVFEYDLRASNAGDFSNGITSIQCMYAPEFTSHSEGVRLKITQEK